MLALLLSLAAPDLDPLDLQRLPHPAACCEQARLCRDHLRYLEGVRGARGWEGGRWDAALAETRQRLAWWRQVEAAHACESQRDVSRCLARLREMVGPGRYRDHWTPPRLPGAGPPPAPNALTP